MKKTAEEVAQIILDLLRLKVGVDVNEHAIPKIAHEIENYNSKSSGREVEFMTWAFTNCTWVESTPDADGRGMIWTYNGEGKTITELFEIFTHNPLKKDGLSDKIFSMEDVNAVLGILKMDGNNGRSVDVRNVLTIFEKYAATSPIDETSKKNDKIKPN